MGGIAVVIPNIDRSTARISQGVANFPNCGANYRPTVFENSIKLAETAHVPNYGRGGLSPIATIRAFRVGVVGSRRQLDIQNVRQVVNSGVRDVEYRNPDIYSVQILPKIANFDDPG